MYTGTGLPNRHTASWGCDNELFSEFSDINGNDCFLEAPHPGGDGWASSWLMQNICYDLQRSMAWKPVFNSENHLTKPAQPEYVPPEHFRTALWQGAIHGQGATAIWCWERVGEYQVTALYGNVMDRPACALAVGTTCLDLNRFAKEVTALQAAAAPAAILYSMASITRDGRYNGSVSSAYSALNFCGRRVRFVSEKQLARGQIDGLRMLILPNATHVLPATLAALRELPVSVRLVIVGDAPAKDPYERPLAAAEVAGVRDRALVLPAVSARELWPLLLAELRRLGALPDIGVVGAETGKPVWGVEWLPAEVTGRTVVNLVNLRDQPVDVRILRASAPTQPRDLLSLGGRKRVRTLQPLTPVLAELPRR
jgi:hypothetical protein